MKILADDDARAHLREAHILIIDDERANVEVLKRLLRHEGFENVTGITDPREALDRYAEFDPDLIMLDLRMPHVDGFTLLQHFRAQAAPGVFLPILVLTSDWAPEARHRALSCGASDFVTRPIDISEVVLRVSNLLATRSLQAELARTNQTLEGAVEARTRELRLANGRLLEEIQRREEAQEALLRQTNFVHMVEVITVAASQSAPVHQTFQVALDQVCLSLEWSAGHAWLRSPEGRLTASGLWHLSDAKFEPLRAEAEAHPALEEHSLAGRTVTARQATWIVDLAADGQLPSTGAMLATGLRSGFAFPVIIGHEVAAVLEFYTPVTIFVDHEMLEVMHQVGAQLARVLERQRAEDALRLSEQANSAKTNFLSRMSHELRTPLNAILGFAQLLDRRQLSHDDREGVDQILSAGNHLLGVINEVLDMARIEVGRLTLSLESINCGEIFAEALSLVRPMASARGIVLAEVNCDGCVVADRQRLRQVLLNLLSNAIKYNREAGTVGLACEQREGFFRMAITDAGEGIPAGKLEQLFKPFERLETHPASVEGIGLGLAISKRLIELMGGRIGVESIPGQGSTFWLTLPMTEEMPSYGGEEILPVPDPQLAQIAPCTVLYIEDNLSNLKVVERILARQPDVHLLAATHGQPGLELAIRHQPSLILLDLHLPDMHGTKVLEQLRAEPRTAHIPVVITSVDTQAMKTLAASQDLIQGHLSKPLEVEKFVATLCAILARRHPPKGGA